MPAASPKAFVLLVCGEDEFGVKERAREAVLALGDDPKGAVASTAARVIALVRKTSANATLGSPLRTMTLAEYLPSRIAELTIHGLDLARALQVEQAAPESALREVEKWTDKTLR